MSTFAGGKPKESQPAAVELTSKPSSSETQPREDDAIYQHGRVVARVADPQADSEAKEIRLAELYNSDEMLLPAECEFQAYTIMVQRIAHATKVDKADQHKERVLRDVVDELLSYREH